MASQGVNKKQRAVKMMIKCDQMECFETKWMLFSMCSYVFHVFHVFFHVWIAKINMCSQPGCITVDKKNMDRTVTHQEDQIGTSQFQH